MKLKYCNRLFQKEKGIAVVMATVVNAEAVAGCAAQTGCKWLRQTDRIA